MTCFTGCLQFISSDRSAAARDLVGKGQVCIGETAAFVTGEKHSSLDRSSEAVDVVGKGQFDSDGTAAFITEWKQTCAKVSGDTDCHELLVAIQGAMPELQAQEIKWLSPQVLEIYVNARPTLAERLTILKETLEWRIENRELLSHLNCPKCSEDSLSHDARCFGTDPDGDLVFMNCFALPRDSDPKGIADHMTCLFERSLAAYPDAKQWTWIIDMHGFGLANLDPRTSINLLHLLQVAYRARLKRCIVIDAPFMFATLWSIIQPFIKARTAEAIVFKTWPDVEGELLETLGHSVSVQLSSEIIENRDPEKVAKKTWTTFWAKPE